MTISYHISRKNLRIAFGGELGHHEAIGIMGRLSEIIVVHLPKRVLLDLSGLSFMDSSGIAVIMQLYQECQGIGSELTVTGTPRQALRVLETAGVSRVVRFDKGGNTACGN